MLEVIGSIQTYEERYKINRDTCKRLKDEIREMIEILRLDDVGLLVNMKEAIIDAQADYHYSILEEEGLIQNGVEGIEACAEDPFVESQNEHREEHFEYLFKLYLEDDKN